MSKEVQKVPAAEEPLVERRVRVAARDVVFVKGICEASEGLCAMFAEHGGDLVLCASRSRERDLDELVRDLCADFDAVLDG
ncbi:MAG TPA: hypothetical protein VMI54_15920 [Polyangiaceae bacterium]|nr:hypothetical protein [Polyangiaceae bacterium]